MFFCFEGFMGGTCSGSLFGVVNNPEDCCFTPERGGLGGGSFVETDEVDCFSCMTIIGEPGILYLDGQMSYGS